MIRFARIDIGVDAGVRCVRCPADEVPPSNRSAVEVAKDIEQACQTWSPPPGPNVLLAGAEPFRHPELPTLIGAARAAGVQRVGLRTDGVALTHGDNAHGSISAGVRLFEFVLLGIDEPRGDGSGDAPGSLRPALAALSMVRATAGRAGVEIALRGLVPVCAHNLLEVPATCAALARSGCASIRLECSPELDTRKALPWLLAGAQTGVVQGCWVAIAGIDRDALGRHASHATDPIVVEVSS